MISSHPGVKATVASNLVNKSHPSRGTGHSAMQTNCVLSWWPQSDRLETAKRFWRSFLETLYTILPFGVNLIECSKNEWLQDQSESLFPTKRITWGSWWEREMEPVSLERLPRLPQFFITFGYLWHEQCFLILFQFLF